MLLGPQLELDQVPGGVVVDVVASVDGRRLGAVVVHRRRLRRCRVLGRGEGLDEGGGSGRFDHRVDRGRGRDLILRDIDDHLHVVRGTEAAGPPVEVHGGGGGHKVVGLSRLELQSSGVRAEGPEGDGKVAETLGLVAHRHDLGAGAGDPAGLELLLGHRVDDVLLARVRADEVELVVLRREVAPVDLQDVVRPPEDGVGGVPVHKVGAHGGHCAQAQAEQHKLG